MVADYVCQVYSFVMVKVREQFVVDIGEHVPVVGQYYRPFHSELPLPELLAHAASSVWTVSFVFTPRNSSRGGS